MNKRAVRGFSLAELVVVIAILAILAAVAIPSITGLVHNAQYTACKTSAEAIYRDYIYQISSVEKLSSNQEYFKVFDKLMQEGYHASPAGNRSYTGICPQGGTYSCMISDDGKLGIFCSVHQDVVESEEYSFIVTLAGLKVTQVDNYFKNRTKSSVDSTADFSDVSYTPTASYVEDALRKVGIDPSSGSWKIYKGDKLDSKLEYYWTYEDINHVDSGKRVSAIQYIPDTKELITGTMEVGTNKPYGIEYHVLKEKTFKPEP